MAPTAAPLSLPGFVMCKMDPSFHHPTSCLFASSVMAASRGEGSKLNTTLVLPMTAPVSPPQEGSLGMGAPLRAFYCSAILWLWNKKLEELCQVTKVCSGAERVQGQWVLGLWLPRNEVKGQNWLIGSISASLQSAETKQKMQSDAFNI